MNNNILFNEYQMRRNGFTPSKKEYKEIEDYINNKKELKDCEYLITALVEIFFKFRDKKDDYQDIDKNAFKLLKRKGYSLNDLPDTMHDFISTKPVSFIYNLKTRGLDINRFCYLKNSDYLELNIKEEKYNYNTGLFTDDSKNMIIDHIDVNIKDTVKNSILFYNCSQNKLDKLLKRKVDVNAVNNSGMNALFNCDYETAKKLICHGVDIYQTDFLKRNALFYCGSNFEKAKMLVENGMNVNQLDSMGRTPLFYAESQNVLQLYLNEGGDRNIVDRNGQTAFQFIRDKILEDKTSLYNNIGIEFLFNIEKEHIVTELGLENINSCEDIQSKNRRRL